MNWAQLQRQGKRQLTHYQWQQLEQLGFPWEVDTRKRQHWAWMYQQLQDFYQQHGHVQVTAGYGNRSLATWVANQRNRANRLDTQQRALLEKLGFPRKGDWEKIQEERWQLRYEELRAFRQQYGHS